MAVLQASWRVGATRGQFLCPGMALCSLQVAGLSLGLSWPFPPVSKMATVMREFMMNFTSEEVAFNMKRSPLEELDQLAWPDPVISIVLVGLGDELAFVNEGKLKGEIVDLKNGSPLMNVPNIVSSKDFVVTANFNLVIIAASAHQDKGEILLDLIQ